MIRRALGTVAAAGIATATGHTQACSFSSLASAVRRPVLSSNALAFGGGGDSGLVRCWRTTTVGRIQGIAGARAASSAPVRSGKFASLQDEDVAFFRSVLGDRGVVTEEAELDVFNRDWMNRYKGSSKVAIKPRTTEQISKILAYCNGRRIAIVPQGGNTGLVGGSVPVFDEVVLSMSLMNAVESFNPQSGVLVCEAGCVLQTLDEELSKEGFIMPLDLGAKGSCQIGGNVSTNAGGLRLLRYGSLHGSVLGIEAVLADGTILDCLSGLRKDNTGYDIKQLFIGAEGTLGIVTRVSILAPRKPTSVQVAVVACENFQSVLDAVSMAQKRLCEIVSAIEFIDRSSMDLVLRAVPEHCRNPMQADYPFYVLIETSGSSEAHDHEKLDGYLEACMEAGCVTDGVVAQGAKQAAQLWKLREKVPLALAMQPAVYKYDLSVPQQDMYDLVEAVRERLSASHPQAVVVGYGHLGDGNLHLNVYAGKREDSLLDAIEPFVYEWAAAKRGSISAEHGLGLMKADCIGYTKGDAAVHVMRGVKDLFDPNGILNPYKVLPARD